MWTAFLRSLVFVGMLLLALSLPALASCGLTLGPTVQREFILVKPGQPIRILSNAKVRGQRLDDEAIVDGQAIGGWVAMPAEHWDIVKQQLERSH